MIDDLCLLDDALDGAAECLQRWRASRPAAGVLALVAEASRDRVPALQAIARAAAMPLVGAVFPALVTATGFAVRGTWLLCLDPMPPTFLLEDVATADGVERLAAAMGAHLQSPDGRAPPLMFTIFDALVPNIGTLMMTAHSRLPAPPRHAGANAGSERFQPIPCLFDATREVAGGVLGLCLPPDMAAVVRHGYPVSGTQMRATSTTGNRIDRIDGRPAFTVYREVIWASFGVALTHANFYEYAVHFPLGVITMFDVLVRIPVGFTDDGAVVCVGEVPPNSVLRVLEAPAAADDALLDGIVRGLNVAPGTMQTPLLNFYCAGRRMHFGAAESGREIERLRGRAGAAQIVGALSLGEIDSIEDLGFPRFHNAALVCLART